MRIEWLKFINYVPARIKRKSLGFVLFLRFRHEEGHELDREELKKGSAWMKKVL